MKIATSNLDLNSRHAALERSERRETLSYWEQGPEGQKSVRLESQGTTQKLRQMAARLTDQGPAARLEISEQASTLQPQKALLGGAELEAREEDDNLSLEMSLLKSLVEGLTGRKLQLFKPAALHAQATAANPGNAATPSAAGQGQGPGWGLVYDYYESHYEEERTLFTAQGKVRTADGQELNIQVELGMSRSFQSETQFSLRAGEALKDPLVVNFGGSAAQLTQRRFSFDLDRDGRADQIAFVGPGSGFLALDRDQDGIINDGGELFGPTSGDGFQELARHDADGNQWIDEADPIYDQLRIWSKDAAGNDFLVGLGQAGIGAIYLGRVETPFKLTGDGNETLGQVRSTGLFLREDGGAGTVQQIDLKV